MNARRAAHPTDEDEEEQALDTAAGKEDRHFVTALARGLDVLRAFKSGEERLGNQELSERCKLPKSTVTRLTYTLTKLGYLHHIPESGRYRLGMATLTLGGTTLARLDVKEVSRPLMQALAYETSTLISLGVRDDMSMLYIENCRGHSIVTLRLEIGSRIPLATTAMGRAYLAGVPDSVRQGLEERIQAFDPMNWQRVEPGIRQAMSDLAEHGCCCSFGEWHKEINGIAVPLSLGNGLPVMVVNAAGPAQTLPAQTFMREVRPALIATVREIERQLGARR
jgi:DNA-binding IclR family transcriptional regulator